LDYRRWDLARLWSRSNGKCAFPDCPVDLTDELPGANVGNICHIIARREGGPRWSSDYPAEKLNGYENLLLLCPSHHALVDLPTSHYTADDLRKMKADHENWVSSRLSIGRAWRCNVEQLYYVNVPRLAMLAAVGGVIIDPDVIPRMSCLHDLGIELARPLVVFERVVSELAPAAITFSAGLTPSAALVGTSCSFSCSFRTKHFPYLDDFRTGKFKMRGDVARDPCVHARLGPNTLHLSIDPRWVTTTTSFSTFKEGWGRFAGLATVKSVDASTRMIYASPMFVGIPKPQQHNGEP